MNPAPRESGDRRKLCSRGDNSPSSPGEPGDMGLSLREDTAYVWWKIFWVGCQGVSFKLSLILWNFLNLSPSSFPIL